MRPKQWFLRIWHTDPEGEGPDTEEDIDCDSEKEARELAKRHRKENLAGAFERRNIHVPDDIPIADPPMQFWDWDDVQIDQDEEDFEYRLKVGAVCTVQRKYNHGAQSVVAEYEAPITRITAKRAYINDRTWFALDDITHEVKPKYLDYLTVVTSVKKGISTS